ncbi:MAG: UbiA family prenyltransferase [Gemmatimonadetes bacterium]|nr:UbiA family prenyltransferase [Gemmatimonadota bacterium]MBI3081780.1 UbiA family prenyltransferase [Gemmatimonadota bacterium]
MTRKTQARRADLRPTMDATGEPPREGQTFAGQSLLVRYVNFVKLPHTVFALPFALLGVVYASTVAAVTTVKVGLVIVAFTAARFAAMGFNRIVDREADARNPRTRDRELPAGRLSVRAAGAAVTGGAAVFVVASGLLNRVCLYLSPVALAWILGYSYTKRWTYWSHFWLGAALAIAPVGGYLAIAGAWSTPAWTLLVLALAVAAWVGGFDVFYALQDEEFDRQHGLKSAIVALGRSRAILAAKLAHGLTIALLVGFGAGAGLGAAYYVGIVVAAVLLVWEHRLVKPDDLSRLDAAFFTMNGVMSIVVFLGALADRVI